MKVIFISSVGGHLTQLLQLKEIFGRYDYLLVTEKTDITTKLSKDFNIAYLMYGSRFYKLKYVLVCIVNFFKTIYLFIKHRPDCIVTTGTHTAVLMCILGWMFRKKVIYIESFAKKDTATLTGKILYKFASTFVVQHEEMLSVFPKAEYWGGIY